MSVYNRIDSVRKGITWKYINDHVDGAYHGRMTDLKHDKTTLSDTQLFAVAELLGTTVDYLLEKTDDPTPPEQKGSPPHGGEPPTIEDWEKALDGKSKEELKEIMDIVMKKFMETN